MKQATRGSKLLAVVVITGLMTLSGCSHRTGGVMASSTGVDRIDNASVSRDVTITNLRSRLVGGFMQGTATLTSLDSTDLNLQYKFTWFDGSGFVIDDDSSPWLPLTLFGKQQTQVQAMAPAQGAVSFEVYVRQVFAD
ncbi:YcfL family protein [Shewanella sp. NIFS-20-20]|uniref:YcfL family protein n=1 Tax=Shewanella sp. NIFS-20-20 TaxID=2853806 RepID=UPI001C48FD64|nr:YcfL family protein [Shewanella sp. NIFS-20-20]MBV7317095.1 YcfL family protein [Shewanella sp. NIFS-20-20]